LKLIKLLSEKKNGNWFPTCVKGREVKINCDCPLCNKFYGCAGGIIQMMVQSFDEIKLSRGEPESRRIANEALAIFWQIQKDGEEK
jgi:hypothetical protein